VSKILVTGAAGQIGSELVPALRSKFGSDAVVGVDIKPAEPSFGLYETLDISNRDGLVDCLNRHGIDTVYHLVSLLSATGEKNPQLAWDLNVGSLKTILDLAVEKNLHVFWPSSIAAFGPTTPADNTPQHTILEPTTMYGVTKVTGELLCQYYSHRFGIDVRSLRYPGLISWQTEPGGGTTDYSIAMFYSALKGETYDCYLQPDTALPMMYMDDAVRATIQLMEANPSRLTVKTSYNLASFSFTPAQLQSEIASRTPLAVTYTPDFRQQIADSWPNSIDDSAARADWDWQPQVSLPKMVDIMLEKLAVKLKETK